MAWMQAIGAAISLFSAKAQADSANAAAEAEQAQLNAEQARLNASALSVEAQSQREAEAHRRKADLMLSRALAVGAASGAGTTGLDSLLRDLGAEGETAAGYSLYEGKDKAAGLRYQGEGLRYRGEVGVATAKAQGKASMMSAVGSSALSIGAKYGGSMFTQTKAAPIVDKGVPVWKG